MLISHQHKFITIDIPKTGTRSLRLTLKDINVIDMHGGPEDSSNTLRQHGTIIDIEDWFNKNKEYNFEDYYKYSVIRNPWDRYLSFYNYYKTKAEEHSEDTVYPSDRAKRQGEFASRLFDGGRNVLEILIQNQQPQSYYLLNKNGDLNLNRITKFEDLSNGFDFFCQDVGIKGVKLKHLNKSTKYANKKDVYTQELIDKVAEKENWAIKTFNYDY